MRKIIPYVPVESGAFIFIAVLDGIECVCTVSDNNGYMYLQVMDDRGFIITACPVVGSPDFANIPLGVYQTSLMVFRASKRAFVIDDYELTTPPQFPVVV